MDNIGCRVSQRLTAALVGTAHKDYEVLSKLIYNEFMSIANEQRNGDWLEMPNGDTYTKTFTVTINK